MRLVVLTALGALTLAIWLYLLLAHGRFWHTSARLPRGSDPDVWPSVVAIIPARNEAEIVVSTVPTVVGQRYPGRFRVLVVDDASDDGTGGLASAAGAVVVRGDGPPTGWVGKVAAMSCGVAVADSPDYFLFTDADIAYPPDALTALVRAATAHDLVLTSQMVRLRAQSRWERWLVPAFVYFFAQLYPFGRVNGPGRTAAAAGGCMLVRRDALHAAGGLVMIQDALIDDVSLARLLKGHGRIWLGLSPTIDSARPYPRLADLWQMIARSAYTQLRCNPLLLLGTVAGLSLTYLAAPLVTLLALATALWPAAGLAGTAWVIMTATYVPMLRFYGLSPARALGLPVIATLYAAMTVDSARRHRTGRGGAWKGRVGAGRGA